MKFNFENAFAICQQFHHITSKTKSGKKKMKSWRRNGWVSHEWGPKSLTQPWPRLGIACPLSFIDVAIFLLLPTHTYMMMRSMACMQCIHVWSWHTWAYLWWCGGSWIVWKGFRVLRSGGRWVYSRKLKWKSYYLFLYPIDSLRRIILWLNHKTYLNF